jgi:hypothetical protein
MVVLPQVRQPQLAKRGDICDDPRCLRKGAWIESWGLGHGRDLATAGSENHRKSPKIDWSTGKHHHLPWFTMVYHGLPSYSLLFHGQFMGVPISTATRSSHPYSCHVCPGAAYSYEDVHSLDYSIWRYIVYINIII